MPLNQKVVPSSPNSSSSTVYDDKSLEGITLRPFKLKPKGVGATINTLVENDSLSSYSLPEETKRPNEAKPQAEEKASDGASRDSSENEQSGTTTLSPKRNTVIDIDQLAELVQEPTYVEAYMKVMYWTCLSPFNPARTESRSGGISRCDLVLKIIQKVLFASLIGLSFVKSFFQVKYNLILYRTYSDLESFIDMMFYFMHAGTKVYYVYLFVFLQKQLSRMLTGLDKLRDFRKSAHHSNSNKNRSTTCYAVKLLISSIVMTFIQTIFYSGVWKWTPQKGILVHSRITAVGVYLWSKEYLGNETWVDDIVHDYGEETNTTTLLLGTFGFMTHFCSYLYNEATGDMMQMQAETVREEMGCLQNRIRKTENDEQNATLTGFFRLNGEWAHSRLLTQALDRCNDTLDVLMKLKHVNNLMLYVFFVLNFLDGDLSLAFLAYLLYGICKSSYTYRIAAEASSLNTSKREWIRRLAWKSRDEEFLKRVPLLRQEIKENPVGMGKGQFLINESFIYRFLGWVGSIFVLQAQSREAQKE